MMHLSTLVVLAILFSYLFKQLANVHPSTVVLYTADIYSRDNTPVKWSGFWARAALIRSLYSVLERS